MTRKERKQWNIGTGILLAIMFVVIWVCTGWTTTYSVPMRLGATNMDSLQYTVIQDGVTTYTSAVISTPSSQPQYVTLSLNDTSTSVLRIFYYDNDRVAVTDQMIDLRLSPTSTVIRRYLQPYRADSVDITVRSNTGTNLVVDYDTLFSSFPVEWVDTLSAGRIFMIEERWYLPRQTDWESSISHWQPPTEDTSIYITDTIPDTIYAGTPPATDTNKCNVAGYLYDGRNLPVPYRDVTFTPPPGRPNECSDAIIASEAVPVTVQTNQDGYFHQELVYSSCFGDSAYYRISWGDAPRSSGVFIVPDTSLFILVADSLR